MICNSLLHSFKLNVDLIVFDRRHRRLRAQRLFNSISIGDTAAWELVDGPFFPSKICTSYLLS